MIKKQFINIISSPLYSIVLVLSIFCLLFFYIGYNKYSSYEHVYSILNFDDATKYDEKIDEYYNELEELDPKTNDYDSIKSYYLNTISIYEELKNNKIDYSEVYDFGTGGNDFLQFFIDSELLFVILILINIFVILYLVFSREFDNYRYVFIYEYSRKKILFSKIITSFLVLLLSFFCLLLVNYIIASLFEHSFKYVLIIENGKAYFININEYFFNAVIFFVLYVTFFFFILSWRIVLLVKKTAFFAIVFLTLICIFIIMCFLRINLIPFLGLSIDESIVSYFGIYYPRLFILIPVFLLFGSSYFFEKCDL